MNIDSTVKDISDKNAALKAAIASGNPKAIESTEKALQEALNKVKNTTLIESESVSKAIKASLATLAIEAAKRQSQAFDSLNKKGELLAREAETIALVRDIKLGAVKAISGATNPLEEAKAQFEKIAGLNIPQKQKDDLIKIIQGGLAQDGQLKRTLRNEISDKLDELNYDMKAARQNDDLNGGSGNDTLNGFDGDDRLLNTKELTEANLKLEDMKTRNAENLLRKQQMLADAGGGFNNDVGGLNMPVLAPVTNNSDNRDMSVTNNITNIYGALTDPLEGFYGGPSPTRQ